MSKTNKKAPGKAYRKGISLMEAVKMFDTEEKAEQWFIEQRWPDGIACPHCESDNIAMKKDRKPQPYRCRTCRKHFSIKDRNTSAQFQYSSLQVGYCLLPVQHQSQRCIQHEIAP